MDAKGALQTLGNEGLERCPPSNASAWALISAAITSSGHASVADDRPRTRAEEARQKTCAAMAVRLEQARAAAASDPAASRQVQSQEILYQGYGCRP